MGVLFANRVKTTLSAAATAGATSLTLSNVANLPAIGGGNYCYLTLTSADQTVMEVVKATAIAGSVVTVTRAQEGTTAAAWGLGTPIELRLTTQALLDALAERLGVHAAADTALKLAAPRNFSITGDMAWTVSFDGSLDVTAAGTIQAGAVTNGKLANMAAAGFKGASAAGAVADIDATTARNILSITNVENKSSATIRGEITSSNVTTGLGFTPEQAGVCVSKTGATMTGNLFITRDNAQLRLMLSSGNVGWRAINGGTGTTDGALTLQHSTDAFAANFTNALVLNADGSASHGGNVSVTGTVTATNAVIGQGTLVARGAGAGGEGGQITLGYGNNAATTISGQANSTWNIDVDANNALRVFRQGSTGTAIVAMSIAEADGSVTVNTPLTSASQTVNGTLTVNTNNSSLNISCAVGTQSVLFFQRAGSSRFAVSADNATESGSNAGSNFNISRYSDAGAWVDNPLSITRSTGDVAIAHSLTVNGGRTVVGMGSDGGMEVGQYIDFHNPTSDGVDFRGRVSAGSDGSMSIQPSNGTLTMIGSTLWLYSGAQNLLVQHDGSNGYIRTAAGKGTLALGANGNNNLWMNTDGSVTTGYQLNASVLNVTGFDATYNVGVKQSRTGSVGYHMYNGGGAAEWLIRQPAAAQSNALCFTTYVAGTYTDRMWIAPSGVITAANDFYARDIHASRGDGTGVIYLNAASDRYLYYNGTEYILNGAKLDIGGQRALSLKDTSRRGGDVTISTAAPSGGSNGDVWFQV